MVNQDLGRVAVVLRGEYDPAAEYERLDCVSYQGSSYLVRKHCTGVTPAEGEYYQLGALAGSSAAADAAALVANAAAQNANEAAGRADVAAGNALAAANEAEAATQVVVGTVVPEVNQLKEDKLDKPATPPSEAGKVLRVLAVNEDGTFTCEWADAPSGGGAVDDVQVDGISIVNDGIANIPISDATSSKTVPGVVKINWNVRDGGLFFNNGLLKLAKPSNELISERYFNDKIAITTNTYDYAVKAAMCDGKGPAWTTEEQAAAQERIGLGLKLLADVTIESEEGASEVILFDDFDVLSYRRLFAYVNIPSQTFDGNASIALYGNHVTLVASDYNAIKSGSPFFAICDLEVIDMQVFATMKWGTDCRTINTFRTYKPTIYGASEFCIKLVTALFTAGSVVRLWGEK